MENQQILETHKRFSFFVEAINTQAVKLAKENPNYDRDFFSPWNKASQIVLNDFQNSAAWPTQNQRLSISGQSSEWMIRKNLWQLWPCLQEFQFRLMRLFDNTLTVPHGYAASLLKQHSGN
jgi:hypothetical protein